MIDIGVANPGARTRDDEHRDGVDQSVGNPGFGPEQANDGGERGDEHDRRDEPGGHDVGEALNRSTAALGFGN